MSEHIARSALDRMNMREVAVAVHYSGLAADMNQLASVDAKAANDSFLARRADLCEAYGIRAEHQNKPFAFSNGVAIIPVHGSLINRFSYSYGFVTGYNFIRQQTALAGLDPDVTHIAYDHNSHGGEAAGCFECAADIKLLANGKPTLAVIDSNCYSASYALASACDQIVCTPSGGVGSVGVIAMHVSMEAALSKMGYKVTLITAGEHKADGNPYNDLPEPVRKDIQASVEKSRTAFAQLVADNRELDLKAVLATEARIYRADDALAVGLIDAIATPQQAVQAFFAELSGSKLQSQQGEEPMSTQETSKPGDAQAAAQAATQAAADARTAERARISGIQSCEEAKGREALANHLALNTDMSLDAAKGILGASPKAEAPKEEPKAEAPKAETNGFKQAMDNMGHPNVGADGAGAAGTASEMSLSARILADQAAATGVKHA